MVVKTFFLFIVKVISAFRAYVTKDHMAAMGIIVIIIDSIIVYKF